MAFEPIVNESSTAHLYATFYDATGALQTPVSVTYRIEDVSTGRLVRDDTSLSPNVEVEIVLTPEDNSLPEGSSLPCEKRRVTLTATYAASEQITSQYVYRVLNLAGIR